MALRRAKPASSDREGVTMARADDQLFKLTDFQQLALLRTFHPPATEIR
jgi:hypothetical protein